MSGGNVSADSSTPDRFGSGCRLFFVLLWVLLLAGCASTEQRVEPEIVGAAGVAPTKEPGCRGSIRVMTLNLAHGRGSGFHQALQDANAAQHNLDRIGRLLAREVPDLVALQEADGPSLWSGNFDHVAYLAAARGYANYVRGEHVSALGLSYGTGLLANLEIGEALAVTFDPALSQPAKGFVVSAFRWPGAPGFQVDVVSLHLDAFNAEVRDVQARRLVQELRERRRPLVVMGDFNTGWGQPDSALRRIAAELDLRAYRPLEPGLSTFPALQRRLDWILVSPELDFLAYRVLDDRVSDHRAVLAELGLREDPASFSVAERIYPGDCRPERAARYPAQSS